MPDNEKYQQRIQEIKNNVDIKVGGLLREPLSKLKQAHNSFESITSMLNESELVQLFDIQNDINAIIRKIETSFYSQRMAEKKIRLPYEQED